MKRSEYFLIVGWIILAPHINFLVAAVLVCLQVVLAYIWATKE